MSLKLNQYGERSKAFSEKKEGLYDEGFNTTLRDATDKDIELAEHYGIELVSQYHKVLMPLIHLIEKRSTSTLTSNEKVYYVAVGKTIWGKLSISIQQIPNYKNTIWYYYQFRTEGQAFRRRRGDSKYQKGGSHRQWKRQAHKREQEIKNMKEE
ncbi:hypothetical protein GPK34_00445 [Secundilactobacillus kimchicus]|uniref:hypothetical protein n=1 Tax=Secundilactobacillus kimchicus TaxID=528209 RepID=UPI001C03058B|nr:hypothetical protein [Secundilactobacillus kimchicus]MBT9670506.1 hypothetical protein [Secundilactobacillus kimchicus]